MLALLMTAGVLAGWLSPAHAAGPVTITTVAEWGLTDIRGTATLAGGDNPTGTVTFRVFGPGDDNCARAPLFTSTNPVTGVGDPRRATSDPFTLPTPGVYHVVAGYNGDARNGPAGPTPCAEPNAAIGYGNSSFSFAAQASGPAVVGGSVSDTATIATSSNPTDTMSFALFGPDVADCSGTPAFTSTRPVRGNGSYTSDSFVPMRPGDYRWVASFSGDANDARAATACSDPAQRVEVTAASSGAGTVDRCILPAGAGSIVERRLAAYRQLLQAFGDGPLSGLLTRAGGPIERALTPCRLG